MPKLPVVVAAITGTAAGLCGALALSAFGSPSTSAGPAPGPAASRVQVIREVHTVERVADAAGDDAPAADDPTDAAEAVERDVEPVPAAERFAEQVGVHEASARDAAWADAAQSSLVDDLGTLGAAAGFAVSDVDCRTRSCLAELEWPSFEAAQASWEAVLHMPNHVECGTGLLLEPPADPSVAYRTRVVFHCARTTP